MSGLRLEQNQDVEMQMQPEMVQLMSLSQRIKTHEEPKRLFVLTQLSTIVNRAIDQVVTRSDHDQARALRSADPLDRAEFERLMIQKTIARYSKRIAEILGTGKLTVNKHAAMISQMLEGVHEFIEAALLQRRTHIDKLEMDEKMERLLLKLYEEHALTSRLDRRKETSHFSILREKGKVIVRKLKASDVPAIARLYSQFQFTSEGVMDVAMGEDTQETFLNEFEAEEGPAMREMLELSATLEQRETAAYRREFETMEGYAVASERDRDDIWGVCIYRKSPLNPAADKSFRKKNEEFLQKGISGGAMHYPPGDIQTAFRQQLLEYPSLKLFLVAGKEPGAVDLAHAYTLRNMKDVSPDERCFTYTMGGLAVKYNGKPVEGQDDSGQNARCITWLNKNGYKHSGVSDENPTGPFKHFELMAGRKKVVLETRARWIHFKARFLKVQENAVKVAG